MTEARVTMAHIRACRLCAGGTRQFFARYGLDWSSFLRDGIPADELEATGDALTAGVVALARKEAATDGQQ